VGAEEACAGDEAVVRKYLHPINEAGITTLALEPSNRFTLLLKPVICARLRNITL
jgi:hypothetical protein